MATISSGAPGANLLSRNFPCPPRPPPPNPASCPEGVDFVDRFAFQLSSPVGSTTLRPGYDISVAPPAPITCKAVDAEHLDGFMKHEGQVLQVLNCNPHQGLPTLVHSLEAEENGRGYLIFPKYYADLHTHIRECGPLPDREAATLFRQLVSAVSHCHDHSVVLRDLKLGKIMFSDRHRTKLIIADLAGAESFTEAEPIMHNQRGSPAYVAPEILSGKPYKGTSADVWALGVILHVMLTGTYPFKDATPSNLFRKIVTAPLQLPSSLSTEAVEVLDALLSKDPAMRPTAREILSAPWLQERVAQATAVVEPEDDQVVPDLGDLCVPDATCAPPARHLKSTGPLRRNRKSRNTRHNAICIPKIKQNRSVGLTEDERFIALRQELATL